LLSERLIGVGALTVEEREHLREHSTTEMDAALLFAQSSPWPSPADLTTDVYA
jgi:TPP-dependent pyruvate/acetoin dehydrogenase alpha subunit